MDIKAIVKTIESLPPLSNSALFVQQLYMEGAENVDIIKLVRIIESDAALSVNILKMINAPAYGFSRKIASVSQAVTLFGTEIIYGLVMKYSLMEALKADTSAYRINSDKFNDVCHLQSALMMQWFSKIDLRHAQFLSPLALIIEIGKLVLAKAISESGEKEEFRQGLRKSANIPKFEYSFFGTTSYYVSALLFEHWNLEPLYIEMLKGMDFKHEEDFAMDRYIDSLKVVRAAINVKEILTDRSIEKACTIVEEMDLDIDHFRRIAKRIRESYEKR